jgi:hypothetical protein
MLTLGEVEAEVCRLAAIIGASERHLPTFGRSDEDGRPHIEIDAAGYHYAVRERGTELSHFVTRSLNELLYRAFADITFGVALAFEVRNRVEGQDSRRLMFAKQEELLAVLSPDWAKREKDEHERILRQFPFDDANTARVERIMALRAARAERISALRAQGLSPEAAWKEA